MLIVGDSLLHKTMRKETLMCSDARVAELAAMLLSEFFCNFEQTAFDYFEKQIFQKWRTKRSALPMCEQARHAVLLTEVSRTAPHETKVLLYDLFQIVRKHKDLLQHCSSLVKLSKIPQQFLSGSFIEYAFSMWLQEEEDERVQGAADGDTNSASNLIEARSFPFAVIGFNSFDNFLRVCHKSILPIVIEKSCSSSSAILPWGRHMLTHFSNTLGRKEKEYLNRSRFYIGAYFQMKVWQGASGTECQKTLATLSTSLAPNLKLTKRYMIKCKFLFVSIGFSRVESSRVDQVKYTT